MLSNSTIRPRRTFSWFLLILANTLWACSYVAAKFALRDTSVNLMNALRMIISALVLLPFLIAWRKEPTPLSLVFVTVMVAADASLKQLSRTGMK